MRELVEIIIAVLTFIAGRKSVMRTKIMYTTSFPSLFKVKGKPGQYDDYAVATHFIELKNWGNVTANNVKIQHNTFTENINIYPSVEHSIDSVNKTITINKLRPKEYVYINYLYPIPPLDPNNIYPVQPVKSDEGIAEYQKMATYPLPPKWLVITIYSFAFFGLICLLAIATVVYKYFVK